MPSSRHRCGDAIYQFAIIEFQKQGHTYTWSLKMEFTCHPFKPTSWFPMKTENWALYTTSNHRAKFQAQVWRCYLSSCYHWVSKTGPYIHMKFENGFHMSSIQTNLMISLENRELKYFYLNQWACQVLGTGVEMLFIKLLSLSLENRAIHTHELWKWSSHVIHSSQPNEFPWKQTTKLFIPQVIIMPSFRHSCGDAIYQVAIIKFQKQGHTYTWSLKMEFTCHPFKLT